MKSLTEMKQTISDLGHAKNRTNSFVYGIMRKSCERYFCVLSQYSDDVYLIGVTRHSFDSQLAETIETCLQLRGVANVFRTGRKIGVKSWPVGPKSNTSHKHQQQTNYLFIKVT